MSRALHIAVSDPHTAPMSAHTLVSAWAMARDRLRAAGVELPVNDARALLEAAAGVTRAEILTDPQRALSAGALARLDALTARRAAREPLAYVLGWAGFWTLTLNVDARVLTPRPDTETLVKVGLERLGDRAAAQILDLGTGSGAILLALLSERADASGLGIDLSEGALRVAEANAERLSMLGRARFAHGDWLSGLRGPFDLIVSNPPYIATAEFAELAPEVAQHEPRLALEGGEDGLEAYRRIVPDALARLAPGGALAVEVGAGQAEAVADLFAQAGFERIARAVDLGGIERVVSGMRPWTTEGEKTL